MAQSKMLTRDHLLAVADRRETVEVPEWGGAVELRALTRADQKQIREEATINGVYDPQLGELLMLVHGCVDPVLGLPDVGALMEKEAGVVDRLINHVAVLSGYGVMDLEAAKRRFRK